MFELLSSYNAGQLPHTSVPRQSAYPQKQITLNIFTHTMPPNTWVPGSSCEHTHGYRRENKTTYRPRCAYSEKKRVHMDILICCFDLEHGFAVSLMSLIQWDKRYLSVTDSTCWPTKKKIRKSCNAHRSNT